MTESRKVDAVVVGAGIAGLYQLYKLRERGMSTRVFETGDGVGGTWYWNRYPGARCDVESLSYSYSFSPELEQEWNWTERYPTQPEILRYVNHVADRFDLRKDITFNTRVVSAVYDESTQRWRVDTDTGEIVDAQFLIMATGCLSRSKLPEIPGLDRFQGPTYHTGHWPHEGVDLTGMRVGIIGTGSSAVQSIPVIAEQTADLTVFQRTPAYSIAALNRPLEQSEIDSMKSDYRAWREAQRTSGFGVPVELPTQSALEVSEEERFAKYEAGWQRGTLVSILAGYTDTLSNREANDTAAEFIRRKIRERVNDPEVAETLSPRSYPFGTKRPCLDTNYYETFNKPNVHLVDLRKTPLVELTENGLRTSEQEYAFDAIIFATGFDAMTGALTAIDIRGKGGIALREKWAEGPRSYLGVAVAGFPNLFTITGPSSPSVLSNMIVSIEQHVDWITGLHRPPARTWRRSDRGHR
jgi:cation diffusion facilitator CzcD-associated flavoprotein CzcO